MYRNAATINGCTNNQSLRVSNEIQTKLTGQNGTWSKSGANNLFALTGQFQRLKIGAGRTKVRRAIQFFIPKRQGSKKKVPIVAPKL